MSEQANPITKRHTGHFSAYTDEIAEEICERLAQGQSLKRILKDNHMPTYSVVMRWLNEKSPNYNALFKDKYAGAREAQAEYLVDEIMEIADGIALEDDGVKVARARLRVDTRKWFASKVAAKKYGDRTDLNVTHVVDVADRITRRWKENLAKLNAEEPLTIEGTIDKSSDIG